MVEIHPDSFLKPKGERFSKGRHTYILCECSICKSNRVVDTSLLKSGVIKSCGCLKDLKPKKDRTGEVTASGVLVVGYIGSSKWKFRYVCGHTSVGSIGQAFNNSTGLCNACAKTKTVTERNTTHNMTNTSTYGSWLAMRRRCYDGTNNRYDKYGGNGISVCERWKDSFENFLEDMGEKPEGFSLERLDNLLGYSPDNCVWASNITQANNKSNVPLITDGKDSWSLRRWSEILGLDYKRCWYLVKKKGLDVSDVLGADYKYHKLTLDNLMPRTA